MVWILECESFLPFAFGLHIYNRAKFAWICGSLVLQKLTSVYILYKLSHRQKYNCHHLNGLKYDRLQLPVLGLDFEQKFLF